jgi:hypothetical protein
MPSSPAEPTGAAALRELSQRYDQAYEALARDDLARVGRLLQETETMLSQLQQLGRDPVNAALHRQATESHGRLMGALDGSMAGVQLELGRIRQGRRALRGYGALVTHRLGNRVESRG